MIAHIKENARMECVYASPITSGMTAPRRSARITVAATESATLQ